MAPIAEISFMSWLLPDGSQGLSTIQWMGFLVGSLLIATRLPGLIFPKFYRKVALAASNGRPIVLRVAGGFLWVAALVILVLIVKTLEPLQAVMLVFAVFFTLGGGLIMFFPEAYNKVAQRALAVIPNFALRLISLLVVLLGLWIVMISLST